MMKLEAKHKFASVVKSVRGEMSKSAFAKILGVSHTAVSNWEEGLHIPDSETLAKIANRAGYTLDEFIAFLEGRKTYSPSTVDRIIKEINSLPQKQVALIGRAVSDRFIAIAESVG